MVNDARAAALQHWITGIRPDATGPLVPISGDASFRRYFRVRTGAGDCVAMDAPPAQEDSRPFVDIAARLAAAGVQVPQVLASDLDRGFLLLSDLADRLYLDQLTEATADALYADALDALVRMQSRVSTSGLPAYDGVRLHAEMDLFPTWFLGHRLGLDEAAAAAELAPTFTGLADAALEQPRVFVHRDYHSRNLMVTARDNPGVLDFQDGVLGPVTYDLVSLLRDCYIGWPDHRIADWVAQYRTRAEAAGIVLPADFELRRWFDLMGVQRHLKAIGIFARLWHRDGKPRYLPDIPRTWGYIERLFGRYPELDALARYAEHNDLGSLIARSSEAAPHASAAATDAAGGTT